MDPVSAASPKKTSKNLRCNSLILSLTVPSDDQVLWSVAGSTWSGPAELNDLPDTDPTLVRGVRNNVVTHLFIPNINLDQHRVWGSIKHHSLVKKKLMLKNYQYLSNIGLLLSICGNIEFIQYIHFKKARLEINNNTHDTLTQYTLKNLSS